MEKEKINLKIVYNKKAFLNFMCAFVILFNACFVNAFSKEFQEGAIIQNNKHSLNLKSKAYTKAKRVASTSQEIDYTALDEVKYMLNNFYLYDVENSIKDAKSIDEILKKIGDPYTSYFSEEDYENFINGMDNKAYGIGVYMEVLDEGIRVVQVEQESVADKNGVKAGDMIIKIDGVAVANKTEEEISKLIRGKEGTEINIDVKRDNKILSFKMKREVIIMPTVGGTVVNGDIGYIRIASFGEITGEEFKEVLEELSKENVKGYIIDLTYNGGGYINSALDIGGYFVGENPVVLMKNRDGEVETHNGVKQNKVIDKPIIFIVNDNTASSAEILSAAVKDYGKAFFIGKDTYGKGVAQSILPLSTGGVLKFTTHEFFSPKGNKINKVGVKPDLEVKSGIDALEISKILLVNGNGSKISKIKDKKLQCIRKRKGEKTIKVKFNKDIDMTTLKNNIQVTEEDKEGCIPVEFSQEGGKNINLQLPYELKKESKYYLIINDKVKSKDGKFLTAGKVLKISVE